MTLADLAGRISDKDLGGKREKTVEEESPALRVARLGPLVDRRPHGRIQGLERRVPDEEDEEEEEETLLIITLTS